jgi:CRP-like cAMP-binding protein
MGLLGDDKRNATVVATSPVRLITLDQWDMRRLEKAVPSAAEKIRAAAEARANS